MKMMQLQFGYRKPSAKRGGLARRLSALAMSLLLVCSLPLSAFADTWYLEDGDITVNATESGQTVSQGAKVDVPDSTPVITQKDSSTPTSNTVTINVEENATTNVTMQDVNIVISDPNPESPANHRGEAAVTIDVADDAEAKITLKDVNIDVSGTSSSTTSPGAAAVQITGNGDVTLELDGSNTVQSGSHCAGVEKTTISATDTAPATGTGKLTITDENGTPGSLDATGGYNGAGIGSGRSGTGLSCSGSNITITGSAQVTATGGNYGAGIGGGWFSSGSGITITGSAQVKATGGYYASGIGSANDKDGSNITISGNAQVTAQGGSCGAGIGGGNDGTGSDITITGSAQVTARGGVGGSGIGGGLEGTGSNITISEDAQVKAQGGNSSSSGSTGGPGAAIGSGGKWSGNNGAEANVIAGDLNEGWVAKYAPGTTDMDTATPSSLTYKGASDVTGAQPIVKQEPTCTEDGNRAGFMVGNTQVGGETLQATGHSYGDYTSDNNATCTSDGTKSRACIWCQESDPVTITDPGTMLKHEFINYKPDANHLATCTQDGTKTATCNNCTATKTVTDPATGHSFTNYVSNNDATYEQDGTKTAKCDHPGCDATDTITDPGTRLPAPAFQLRGQDGNVLNGRTEQKNGVLTVTVDADVASLTGYLGGLQALRAQGIDTIVFVTNGATSTFALSDLMATMTAGDSYTLTHDGSTVTFTLATGTDISSILK